MQLLRVSGSPACFMFSQFPVGTVALCHPFWPHTAYSTWCNSKEARLWVDGPQPAFLVKPHPSDIVTHTLHRITRQGGLHHGQVGLATGTGEGCCYVLLLAFRVGDSQDLKQKGTENLQMYPCDTVVTSNSEDLRPVCSTSILCSSSSTHQHVFGQPAFIPGQDAPKSQGKALLPQQGIASVATPKWRNLISLRDVSNQHLLGVARPIALDGPWSKTFGETS